MSAPLRIACVGEAMVELSIDGDAARIGFAGDTLNTAIYLRRAMTEGTVAFVSAVGTDPLSDRLVARVAEERVETGGIGRHPTRIVGLYGISTDAEGERSFVYWRDTSAARTMFASDGPLQTGSLDGFDVVHLSAITLAILAPEARHRLMDWIAAFRARGGRISFDSNYRPRLWSDVASAREAVTALWRVTDIGFPSVDDEMALFGDTDAEAVRDRIEGCGVPTGALKCGPSGPLPLGDRFDESYPPCARVVDTTAAGDSFDGGYLAAWLSGASQRDALRAGHALALEVIGHRGAIMPVTG